MILPSDVQEKVNELFVGLNKKILSSGREQLTNKYKSGQAINKSAIESKQDGIVYAISRMPATYSVIFSLLSDLIEQGKIENVSSIFDIGSGTGAGFFACREIFENAEISLFEREKNMIDIFDRFETGKKVNLFDFMRDEISSKADLVMTNYVFSELSEEGRRVALNKMLDCSNRYVLIVDTGTPRTYENFMKLKKLVIEMGYKISAPCNSDKCGLKNDYCQFYARVERSGLLKLAKNGDLPYEDEKYFYLLIDKKAENIKNLDEKRVIRRPLLKTNFIELKLCTSDGVIETTITKKDKASYQRAKKVKINEIL